MARFFPSENIWTQNAIPALRDITLTRRLVLRLLQRVDFFEYKWAF